MNEIFKVYPILDKINYEAKEAIITKGYYKSFNSGEYVNTAGESCQGFVFIIEGVISIRKINIEGEVTKLYNITKGQICHETISCILNQKSLNIIGEVIQDCKLYMIPIEVTKKYLLKDLFFLQYIYQDMFNKFKVIIEDKEEIIHDSVRNRLIKLLLSKNNNIIYSTHKEIALEIGTSREVVSRKLKEIEREGYIEVLRGKIKIIKDISEI